MQGATEWQGANADCISAADAIGYGRRLIGTRFFDTGEFFTR